jgi:uncharacterized protein YecT (DUF1311 family)
MKRLLLLLAFSCSIGFSFGQSQTQMNMDADKEYQQADKELNAVYQKILTQYKKDVAFIANLKVAQRMWIAFRDADVKARYPVPKNYGSALPMCWSIYLKDLTEARTKALRVWLDGIEEGEICVGSVKSKN